MASKPLDSQVAQAEYNCYSVWKRSEINSLLVCDLDWNTEDDAENKHAHTSSLMKLKERH